MGAIPGGYEMTKILFLIAILMFGGVTVCASTPLSPVSPPPPEGWTWDFDELDTTSRDLRENVLRFVIGGYYYARNGRYHQSDAAPFIVEGRTMVPLRLIAEAMGADVGWDSCTGIITIVHGTTVVTFLSNHALPGGLGTPINIDGRIFVPLRFIAEALGATIEWDSATGSIYVIWVL